MNDAVHYDLCEEFKKIFMKTPTAQLMQLVDSEKYHMIFSWQNLTHKTELLELIYKYHGYFSTYIITTRKIANLSELSYYIIRHLPDETAIDRFFSFYNKKEIMIILNRNFHNFSIYHDKYGYISYTLLITCIMYNKHKLYHYIMRIMKENDIQSFIKFNGICGEISLFYYTEMKKCNKLFTELEEYEDALLFKKSLRYRWIESCII